MKTVPHKPKPADKGFTMTCGNCGFSADVSKFGIDKDEYQLCDEGCGGTDWSIECPKCGSKCPHYPYEHWEFKN